MAELGGATANLENRRMLEYAIIKGHGGVYLKLKQGENMRG